MDVRCTCHRSLTTSTCAHEVWRRKLRTGLCMLSTWGLRISWRLWAPEVYVEQLSDTVRSCSFPWTLKFFLHKHAQSSSWFHHWLMLTILHHQSHLKFHVNYTINVNSSGMVFSSWFHHGFIMVSSWFHHGFHLQKRWDPETPPIRGETWRLTWCTAPASSSSRGREIQGLRRCWEAKWPWIQGSQAALKISKGSKVEYMWIMHNNYIY